jgi:hypothetical protein
MNRQNIIRAMAAGAVILTVNFSVQAQLGGALNRAKEAVQSGTSGQQSTTTQPAQPAAGSTGSPSTAQPAAAQSVAAQQPTNQRAALDKLMNESRRTAPKVPEIVSGASRQGGAMRKFLSDDIYKMSVEEIQAFKAKVEARNAENIEIYGALWDVPGNVAEFVEKNDFSSMGQPSMKAGVSDALSSSSAADELLAELSNFKLLISEAKSKATEYATIRIEGDYSTGSATSYVDRLSVGQHYIFREGDNWMFKTGNPPIVSPVDEGTFQSEITKYTNVLWLLNKAGSKFQYDEYWKADIARRNMRLAQRYSIANEQKAPVPAAQMNDAALTAKMLKLAQEA